MAAEKELVLNRRKWFYRRTHNIKTFESRVLRTDNASIAFTPGRSRVNARTRRRN